MTLLDFLFFYWRIYAPDGFYIRELILLSAVIALVITALRQRITPPKMPAMIPLIWLIFTGYISALTIFLVLGGPPLWAALIWADFKYCRQSPGGSFFRSRGAVRDHT